MIRHGSVMGAAALAAAVAGWGGAPAAADIALPPLRPPELGGPDPVADWSDPGAPLAPSPPKAAMLAGQPEPETPAAMSAPWPAAEPTDEPVHPEAVESEIEAQDEPEAVADPVPRGKAREAVVADERPALGPAEAERCEAELRRLGARFERAEPIADEGCGAERPLALTALPGGIEVDGEDVLLRCPVALALTLWTEQVVQPSAELHLGTEVSSLVVSTTYHCRERAGSGRPSQHAFANAVDLMGLRFADGRAMPIAPRPDSAEPMRAFQAAIRGGACAYFTTVIGPTTNAAHDDHLHLDVKQRAGGYRLCQ